MVKVPPLSVITTGNLMKPPIPVLVDGHIVCHAPDCGAALAMLKKLTAKRQRAEAALRRTDGAGYLHLLDTSDAPPFAEIELKHDKKRCLYVVLVSERVIAEYPQRKEAAARASDLVRFQRGIERRLLAFDPAEYWRRRAGFLQEAAEHNEREAERHFVRASAADWADVGRQQQRRRAGGHDKPPRRAPLRQALVEAMQSLRAGDLTFDAALRSLTHSPSGALRVVKVGDEWHVQHEDADWPPEKLKRETLRGLYRAAK